MKADDFARGTERLTNPITIGKAHYLQHWLHKLPTFLQRKIILSASRKSSKMGFVVEPYTFFLFYEIEDLEAANRLLPDGFKVAKSRVFEQDPERYYGIVSLFRLHTSTFWGARSEFYVVAKNVDTGLTSWVILDYLSDTISYDYKNGLRSAEAEEAIIATTYEGKFLADITNKNNGRRIACSANLSKVQTKTLDEKLWIEGNTSIAYGRELSEKGDLFSLTFLPEEMAKTWEVPLDDIELTENSWYPEIFGGRLQQAACFPFAQHMLSDSPGNSTHYGSKSKLRSAADSVNFDKIRRFK